MIGTIIHLSASPEPTTILHQNILARVSAVVLAFIAQDTSTCFPALVAFATEL